MRDAKGSEIDEPPRDELVLGILHYVTEHPTAKDTIEGIEMWWLPKRIPRESKEKLQQRLNSLVSKGWLSGRRSPQSQTIYSLNEDAVAEINEFLKKRERE
jgi:DNA-binding PadR family transcriptional regulator